MSFLDRLLVVALISISLPACLGQGSREVAIGVYTGKSDTFAVRWNQVMADQYLGYEALTAIEGKVFIQPEFGKPLVLTGLKFTFVGGLEEKVEVKLKFREGQYIVVISSEGVMFGVCAKSSEKSKRKQSQTGAGSLLKQHKSKPPYRRIENVASPANSQGNGIITSSGREDHE